jgi:hypothetical protein
MGNVRINDELLLKTKEWIKNNNIKYKFFSVSGFVNEAIYEKLEKLKKDKNDKNDS